ncbi:MAG: hypothetical protein ACXWKG_11695 [Limisphaerales bacterium]
MEIKLQLSRKPTGKISQLPPDQIEYVNCAVQDGVKYDEIIRELAERGHPGFTKNNLSRWRRSGHAQWLLAEDRRDAMRIRCDSSLDAAKELSSTDKGQLTQFNDKLVALQLADTLWAFQESKPALTRKPENFFKLARLVSDSAHDATRRKMIELHLQKLQHERGSDESVLGENT